MAKTNMNARVKEVLASLKKLADKKTLAGLARYAIPADNAWGVPVVKIRAFAKTVGRDHALAAALWETGVFDARMLVPFIADPNRLTPGEMDRWCRDFDSWAICDALCYHLFDRCPHTWKKIHQWSDRKEEFVKRAAFALLASVALHDKKAEDDPFLESLPLVERAAVDERNFVKKGVSWALRGVGRRNAKLHQAAVDLAKRLAKSESSSARWIGKDAVKDLSSAATSRRLAARSAREPSPRRTASGRNPRVAKVARNKP